MFAGKSPVNPEARKEKSLIAREWKGTRGLAEDVRYYGQWMRGEAEKRIGHLYPNVLVTAEMIKVRPDLSKYEDQNLTVIAWIWARTVKSPNPAFAQVDVPLASTFMLSARAGKEAYVEPVIENSGYRFTVNVGKPMDAVAVKSGTKLSRGANFRCLMSNTPIESDHIYGEARAGRMGTRLMAIVAAAGRGRVYLAPTPEMEAVALTAQPTWKPEVAMPDNPRWFSPPLYGLKTYGDLFTPRQLVALTTFSDLVLEARERVKDDSIASGLSDDGKPVRDGGTGATAYADAVTLYLGMTASKSARFTTTLSVWRADEGKLSRSFGRQAIPMTWDFAETNLFSNTGGDFTGLADGTADALENFDPSQHGRAFQQDAATQTVATNKIVSTDPPYYDNIGYSGLSDYFYVWLRRSLHPIFPDLFSTVATPTTQELVATPYRHDGKENAEAFFLDGMTKAMRRLAEQAHPAFPVTIYYAFKQSETKRGVGTASTGWETFLDAVIRAGFAISGTWPVRTEGATRVNSRGTNVLASSIVLVCRQQAADAPISMRRDFVSMLKAELPLALADMQQSNIAPVDLAQAAIGPGMGVYTRFAKVLDAEGNSLSVREALALINQTLDETLEEQEGDFDVDTRWALAWFEQQGFDEGVYGIAETLSKAKNTSVAGLAEAGILESKAGKVRILRPDELSRTWDPYTDKRLTIWEMVHHLIRVLEEGGESKAALLLAKLGSEAEVARKLCYRLHRLCERKKRAKEALSYNALVRAWPTLLQLASESQAIDVLTAEPDLFST